MQVETRRGASAIRKALSSSVTLLRTRTRHGASRHGASVISADGLHSFGGQQSLRTPSFSDRTHSLRHSAKQKFPVAVRTSRTFFLPRVRFAASTIQLSHSLWCGLREDCRQTEARLKSLGSRMVVRGECPDRNHGTGQRNSSQSSHLVPAFRVGRCGLWELFQLNGWCFGVT